MASSDYPQDLRTIMRRLNRRDLMKSVVVAGGAVVWAGYGHAPRSAFAQGSLTLSQWYHEYGEAGTQDAATKYAQSYTSEPDGDPNVTVNMVWNPGDYGTKLSAALLTPDGPDVYEQNGITTAVVNAKQAVPLDDLYTPDVKSDFSQQSLASSQLGDHVYGVKEVNDTGGIYYRKSMLDAAGVQPPTTIDELIAAVKALGTGRQKALFIGNDGGVTALHTLLPQSGGSQFVQDGKAVFNNERSALSYQKLVELNKTGGLLTGAPVDYLDPGAFTQGLVAMQYTGLWAMPAVQAALGDDFGYIAWPALDAQGTPVTFAGGWTEFVNGNRPNVDAAKKFVQWLWIKRTDYQQDWNLSYGFHVPPRNSIAASATKLQSGTPKDAVDVLNKYGQIMPPTWTAAMDTALLDAVTSMVQNGADPATALAQVEQQVNAELQRQATPAV